MVKKVIRVPVDEELDRLYRRGYEKIPEEAEVGEAQVDMAGEVMPKESW